MSDDQDIARLRARAAACMARNDLDGAISMLEQALAIDGDVADLHAWLALVLVDRRLISAARSEANLALALDPTLSICHHAHGHVLLAEGKRHEARRSHQTAVDLEPDDTTTLLALASIKRLLREDDTLELERALELEPDDPEVLTACSQSAYHRGNIDDAERYAREALEVDPEHGEALIAMGWVLLQRGQLEEAREHAAMALRANPTDDAGLRLLAAYKARKNPFLGLWFRWAMYMSRIGDRNEIIVLLVLFLVYRLASLIFEDLDMGLAGTIANYVWMAIVVYSWIGPAVFARMLKRELEKIHLDPEY
jgi:tetratricopeptide (TPR) repeat protein